MTIEQVIIDRVKNRVPWDMINKLKLSGFRIGVGLNVN
jgi:glycine/serine hydroxymethyltransferase